jgi:hypothetical protein
MTRAKCRQTRYPDPKLSTVHETGASPNIEVAQFVYLLLHNKKIRDVIDAIGKKGALRLGRFTEGRMMVLERLRNKTARTRFFAYGAWLKRYYITRGDLEVG